MKPLLVIGKHGQLAKALAQLRPEAIFLDRHDLDLAYPDRIYKILQRYDPYAVVNAAAYTQVDNAELQEELATRINADSPAIMMQYCAALNIPFVHFSSDYVFDGLGEIPWTEEDITAPLNAYGRSKRAGEEMISRIGGKYLIFRTSWVYDATSKNFLHTILRLSKERQEINVVADQWGAPTYALHLAQASLNALETAVRQPVFLSGIYHLCNQGVASWYGFASSICELAQKTDNALQVKRIIPIPATEYPLPAKRPYNSRLDCGKAKRLLGITMPDWQHALSECMGSI